MPRANLMTGLKVCSRKDCLLAGHTQSIANFTKCRETVDGLKPYCKGCWSRMRKAKGYDRQAWRAGGKQPIRVRRAEQRRLGWSLNGLREALRRGEWTYLDRCLAMLSHCWGSSEAFMLAIANAAQTGNESQQFRWFNTITKMLIVKDKLDVEREEHNTRRLDCMTLDELQAEHDAKMKQAVELRINTLVEVGYLRWTKKSRQLLDG